MILIAIWWIALAIAFYAIITRNAGDERWGDGHE